MAKVKSKKKSPAKSSSKKTAGKKASSKKKVAAKKAGSKKTSKKKLTAKKASEKATSKKTVAKKSTPKRTTAKKATATKTVAKKGTTAKKTVAKKAAPKSSAKKATAKKTVAKKRTAPKPAAKRTAAKPAAKRTVAKKASSTVGRKKTARKAAVKKVVKPNIVKSYKNEIWKQIKFVAPTKQANYFISNMGRIKSIHKITKSEYLLKCTPLKRGGYLQFNIKLSGDKRASKYVHKLVAEYFKSTKRKNVFVTHLNGDRNNNKVTNIAWMNRDELSAHHAKLGTYKYDRTNIVLGSHVKMTEAKVRRLKKALRSGKKTRTQLSKDFGITMTQIKRIDRGENWGHVTID